MKTPSILVIEDNPITRKMVRVALAAEGYAVLEAPDGQSALELTGRQPPDLILQDLLLPDVDGFDLVKQLRALPGGAAVPILAISGFLSAEQARSLPAGFTDYLFKPVEPSHLVRTVQAYLRPTAGVAGKPGRGRRVLVADDDPLQLKLLKVELEQLGFDVSTAEDGVDALAGARGSPPDALVADVLMPRLDGFRLCLAFRQDPRLARVPVLLTSAVYDEEADRQLARAVSANAFVVRTPGHEELAEALLACLEDAPAPPPADPAALPLEEYTHRVIRQLEHQVSLSASLTHRLALLEVELGTLARIVETLKNASAIDTVLDELLYHCLDAAGISRGATYLLEPDGRLSLRAQLGYPGAGYGHLGGFFGHADLLHRVMERGEPVEVNASWGADGQAADLLARAGARSILIAPLVLADERLGVLQLTSVNRDLGADWVCFAKAVANQVSQAIKLARTLARLSSLEQRYRELVQGLDAIVWEADAPTGQLTFVSQRAEPLLGYPVPRWLAEPDFRARLVHPDDRGRAAALWRAALAEGRDHALEYRLVAADGRVVWFHDTVRGARDAQGRVRQLRGVMVDITERKRAEEQEAKLRLAREIQQGLFPAGPPRLPGFDVGGVSYPAEATGGDYFDYVPMPGGYQGIVVGDVSGHGFGPAVLMAETRAYLRALALTRTDVGEILALLNRALADDIVGDYFVTLLLARLDPRTRSFVYASAGHSRGYVLDPSGGVKAVLESTGPPVGIDPGGEFPASGPIALGPGDLILILTDGVLEARAPDGTFFGAPRVLDLARVYRRHPARQVAEEIFHAIRAFSQNQSQDDDITAVVVKVTQRDGP